MGSLSEVADISCIHQKCRSKSSSSTTTKTSIVEVLLARDHWKRTTATVVKNEFQETRSRVTSLLGRNSPSCTTIKNGNILYPPKISSTSLTTTTIPRKADNTVMMHHHQEGRQDHEICIRPVISSLEDFCRSEEQGCFYDDGDFHSGAATLLHDGCDKDSTIRDHDGWTSTSREGAETGTTATPTSSLSQHHWPRITPRCSPWQNHQTTRRRMPGELTPLSFPDHLSMPEM